LIEVKFNSSPKTSNPLSDEQLGDEEHIVRGVYENEYSDDGKARLSSKVFRGPETSVNRLKFTWETVWYFLRKGQKPPSRILHKGLEITVGELKAIGKAFTKQASGGAREKDSREITVIADPCWVKDPITGENSERNEAHAYIKEKLPDSMAKEDIPKACRWNTPPWL
jgi:hypothetical protein